MYHILIPAYNEETSIGKCLDSIQNDVSKDVSIVVVNNSSTDLTSEILLEYSNGDSSLCVIEEPKPGICNALNAGLRFIKSGWVARMDADDIWLSGRHKFIESVISNKELPSKSILSTRLQYRTPDHQLLDLPSSTLFCDESICEWLFLFGNPLTHPTILYKAEQILALGGYSSLFPYAEDFDLWIRALRDGFSFLKYPYKTVLYTLPSQQSIAEDALNGKRNLQLVSNDALMYRALKQIGSDFTFAEVCLLRIIFDAPELSNVVPSIRFDLQLLLEKLDNLLPRYICSYSDKYERDIPEQSLAILKRDFQAKRKRFVDGFNKLYPRVG